MKLYFSTITKLKLISLFMGMMFWYGIEQLFLDKVLQDPSARMWTTIVFTGTWLVFDVPGGLIADKIGRKNTLVISGVLQTLGVTLLALSTSLPMYLFGAVLYGLHWSTFSGTIQALMYDHLLLDGRQTEYPKHQGAVTAFSYLGAAIANILSGFIADFSNLRMPFIVSIIPAALALVLATSITDQKIKHDGEERSNNFSSYLFELITTVKHRPISLIFITQIIIGLLIFKTICEFGQILILDFGVSATELGFLWALDALLVAVALHFAHYLQKWPQKTLFILLLTLLTFAFTRSPLAIALFMVIYSGTEIMHNIAETELQHVTKSHARATVLSSVMFVGNLLAIPFIWLYDRVMHSQSIFIANTYLALFVAGVLFFTLVITHVHKKHRFV